MSEFTLPTFIHIFQIENNTYTLMILQVTSKQSYLRFHKAPLYVPFCLIAFLMISFMLLKKQAFHNFADDDTLSMFEETIQNFIALLETGSNTAIKWFQNNKMIVNPGKFQAIIIEEKKKCHTNETLKIGDKIINASSPVKLLGVQIDDKLNFNFHISNICRSAANQLNVLIKLKSFLAFEKRRP